jgi:hypothetical protein
VKGSASHETKFALPSRRDVGRAAGIAFYWRSNARQARFRREYRDNQTNGKYEAILEEIRRGNVSRTAALLCSFRGISLPVTHAKKRR